jgi:hypothetical protein
MKQIQMIAGVVLLTTLSSLTAFGQGAEGSDFSSSIPIVFGQVVRDIGDSNQRRTIIYKINLARGQKVSISLSDTNGNTRVDMGLYLVSPNVKSLATWGNADTLARQDGCCGSSTRSVTYQVAAAGTYYIVLGFSSTGVSYKLEVLAEGTPIAVPNPTTAGCVNGRVDYITYSLQLIAVGLPDEVSIGGTKLCANCQVKAPLYPEIAQRLENALRSKVNVEACYDSPGNIFQIKLVQ